MASVFTIVAKWWHDILFRFAAYDIITAQPLNLCGYYMDSIALGLLPLGEPPEMAYYTMFRCATHGTISIRFSDRIIKTFTTQSEIENEYGSLS